MLTNKHFPAHITIEQIEKWLDRVALEIVAVEDPEPVFPWWDFLERELALAKERETRMERVKARIRDRGLEVPKFQAWTERDAASRLDAEKGGH